jgi:Serine/Threonine/Tyrosine Kinase found in polyvalent proteins
MNEDHDPENGQFTSGPDGDNLERSNEDQQHEEDQLRGAAQSPLESAKTYTGRGAETTPGHDASGAERIARVATEQQRLIQWGEQNHKLIPRIAQPDARGGEHDVRFDAASNRYIKSTRLDLHQGYGHAFHDEAPGAAPSEYLDRLRTANRIFADDIRLLGIVRTPKGPSIVTSQPLIVGRDSTPAEIDDYMDAKGFEKLGEGAYHLAEQGLLVHDMHPRNVKTDRAGIVHPIDPIIQRVTPAMLDKVRPLL